MTKIQRFEDLDCRKEARRLVKLVYAATETGPVAKDFEFKGQIRKASVSAMTNIAEGFGRYSRKEFIRFIEISSASAIEVQSLSYAALDLSYFSEPVSESIRAKAEDVKSLDLGLIRYLDKHRTT
jgi:four helix bundle protein